MVSNHQAAETAQVQHKISYKTQLGAIKDILACSATSAHIRMQCATSANIRIKCTYKNAMQPVHILERSETSAHIGMHYNQ